MELAASLTVSDRNVLVVDDDRLICWAIERAVTSCRLGVAVTDTAAGALERLRTGSYHLAFLDIHLPDADGLELLGEIRRVSPDTRVVVISSDLREENLDRAREQGAWQCVEKPFELSAITMLLRRAFEEERPARRHERHACGLPLRLSVLDMSDNAPPAIVEHVSGTLLDVGPGGMRLRTEYALRPGQWLRAAVVGAEDPRARFVRPDIPGEVVWVRSEPGGRIAGVRYGLGATPGRTS